jgi:RNA polymerase sigma factor (TIGR02999 family)
MASDERSVTELLDAWGRGDAAARDALLHAVYHELRSQARRQLGREAAGNTLQPTALVHEAYLRLVDQQAITWQGRAHFFGIAARLMRQILVNRALARRAAKRGGGARRVELDEALAVPEGREVALLALDDALKALAALDPRQAEVVELRCFAGLDIEETAEALGISPATVKRDWTTAKLWLRRELQRAEPP